MSEFFIGREEKWNELVNLSLVIQVYQNRMDPESQSCYFLCDLLGSELVDILHRRTAEYTKNYYFWQLFLIIQINRLTRSNCKSLFTFSLSVFVGGSHIPHPCLFSIRRFSKKVIVIETFVLTSVNLTAFPGDWNPARLLTLGAISNCLEGPRWITLFTPSWS